MSGSNTYRSDFDFVVVGGRCAGAATAMLLARAGARVVVAERGTYGSDSLSTHALMRTAVHQLHRWGLLDRVVAEGTPAIRRTSFHYGSEETAIDIRPGDGIDALYAPRRSLLDRVIVDAACEAGAEFRFGTTVEELYFDRAGRVAGACLRGQDGKVASVAAGMVIGADGRDSTVARMAGARETARSRHMTSSVYGYFEGIENRGYHWYYRPGSAMGAIPTNDGLHCIFASVPRERAKEVFGRDGVSGFLDIVARHDPALLDGLSAARLKGRFRRFPGAFGHMRQAHGPGWALVGDAGYFKDPITAHGISDALRDAELLANAAMSADAAGFAHYQWVRDALSRDLFAVTDAIASCTWTLDEVKAHHMRLNQAMKAEMAHMTGQGDPARSAA